DTDRGSFAELKAASQHHHGELVAMDRSIGNLRSALRRQGIAENTLVWFCSDNGGLPEIQPDTTGGLRGNKGKIYEGGLRVPCLVEWPAGIANPQVVTTPACTMDIFPTIVEIVQAEQKVVSMPRDGISLRGWFDKPATTRESPIGFCFQDNWAMVDDNYKILALRTPQNRKAQESSDGYRIEVYDLINDPNETTNLRTREPKRTAELQATLSSWQQSVRKSVAGKDYPEGRVQPADRQPQHWADTKVYEPYFQQWKQRPEYGDWLRRRGK
ncbi:MAG: sulfatase-like hydrolase/transferase, partial [Planctomycetota bacterium]